jgi:hypothetical protein
MPVGRSRAFEPREHAVRRTHRLLERGRQAREIAHRIDVLELGDVRDDLVGPADGNASQSSRCGIASRNVSARGATSSVSDSTMMYSSSMP